MKGGEKVESVLQTDDEDAEMTFCFLNTNDSSFLAVRRKKFIDGSERSCQESKSHKTLLSQSTLIMLPCQSRLVSYRKKELFQK